VEEEEEEGGRGGDPSPSPGSRGRWMVRAFVYYSYRVTFRPGPGELTLPIRAVPVGLPSERDGPDVVLCLGAPAAAAHTRHRRSLRRGEPLSPFFADFLTSCVSAWIMTYFMCLYTRVYRVRECAD